MRDNKAKSGFFPGRRSFGLWMALVGALLGWGLYAPVAQAAIAYVQSKSTSQNNSAQTTVTTVFSSAQVAGDLNVVAVGWGSATIGISSITDTKGNTYTLAVGPTTVSGLGAAVIYYAKNIVAAAAGANTVTVTFSAAVPYPDVRIAEYSGINTTAPLDVTAVANGTGLTSDSGSASTSNANDLLIGSNWVASGTTGAGAGYTSRQISGYDGDILEDQIVTALGAYNATAPISPSANWIMQMAAFKAASSGADTTAPTPPTTVQATAVSSSQINVSWSGATDNVAVTGYLIERCLGATCTTLTPSGAVSSYGDTGLAPSSTYTYRVRATDAAGNISGYSTVTATATTQTAPAIAYVQSKSTSQNNSAQLSVAAAFTSAQAAGDLNVVAIGWGSATAISSISDTKGNTYTLAVGPTYNTGVGTAAIYYAKNIVAAAAGANTVTVTFSAAVPYPDIRIAEYSGISTTNPLDVTAVASGNGTTSDSGLASTSNANDLLIGSNLVASGTTGAGPGYTSRQISGYDGDILEDRIVTAVGAYNATAPISPSAVWIMQMAAFKSAVSGGGGGGDTTPPGVPTAVNATVVSSTQINLSWTAPTDNVGVTGYSIQRCQGSNCTSLAPSGTATSYSDTGLSASTTYSYQVRATDAAGNWSGYSTPATSATTSAGSTPDTTPPTAPVLSSAVAVASTQINLAWGASTDNVGVTGYQLESCAGAGCSNFASLGAPVTTTTYSATGLTAGAVYGFRLRASDAAGNLSNYSNVLSATTPTAAGSSSTVAYDYDALGRLVQAEMPALGTVQAYNYDPAGNITSSIAAPITALTFGGLSAQQGAVGGQITVYGSGFSTTAGSNTVTIGGVVATVVSATATRLVVTVPAGATTGSISVTTGGSTVTSSRPFVIIANVGIPTIASFSPNIAAAGDSVTLSGANFDPVLARNKVSLNGVVLPLTSGTTTTLTVKIPPIGASGHLQVVTPRGSSPLTTGYLIIPPPSYAVGNIGPTGSVTENGAANTLTFASATQVLLGLFDAQAGEKFIRVLASLSSGTAQIHVFGPDGQDMGTLSPSGFMDLPRLNKSGTYTIAVSAPSTAPTNFTFSVAKAIVKPMNTLWQTNANVTSLDYVRGLAHRFTVSGVKGETLGLLFPQGNSPRSDVSGYPVIQLVSPQGAAVWQTSVASGAATLVITGALPTTDTYTVVIDPGPSSTAGYAFAAGSGVNMAFDDPAAMLYADGYTKARVFFQAAAGQAFSLHATHDPLYPSINASFVPYLRQLNPTGCCDQNLWAQVGLQSLDFSIQVRPLLVTGSYYIEFDPSSPGGAFDVRVLSAPSVAITSNVATLTIPTVGQAGRFTFSGTAGVQTQIVVGPSQTQSLGSVQYQLAAPDGTFLTSWQLQYLPSGPGPTISLVLPQSGQYSLWVVPVSGTFGSSFSGNPPTTNSSDTAQIVPGSVVATVSNLLTSTIAFNASGILVQSSLQGQSARITVNGVANNTGSLKVVNSSSCAANIKFENAAQPGNSISYSATGSTTSTFSLPVTTIKGPYLLEVAPVTGCVLNLLLQLTGN